jgi:hypothetical protein
VTLKRKTCYRRQKIYRRGEPPPPPEVRLKSNLGDLSSEVRLSQDLCASRELPLRKGKLGHLITNFIIFFHRLSKKVFEAIVSKNVW